MKAQARLEAQPSLDPGTRSQGADAVILSQAMPPWALRPRLASETCVLHWLPDLLDEGVRHPP